MGVLMKTVSATALAVLIAAAPLSAANAAEGQANLLSLRDPAAQASAASLPKCGGAVTTNCKRKAGGKWILIGAGLAAVIGVVAAAGGHSSSP